MPAHRRLTLMMSIIVWCCGTAHVSAQTLTGRIVRQDDPTVGVAGARVSLAGDPAADPVFTNAQGRFALPATAAVLPDALHIAKAGFLSQTIAVATLTQPLIVSLVRGAAISGVVRDAGGTPVRGVTVRVTRRDATDGREARTTATDDRGAYRIARLESGQYRVNASSDVNGVAIDDTPVAASLVASDVVTVDVHAGDDIFVALTDETGRLVLALDRGAIEGFVRNEAGEPAEGMIVRAFRGSLVDGRRRLQQVWPDRMTDDRGRYRLFNLPPGQYLVQVEYGAPSSRGAAPASVPIYFPSAAAAADAVAVRVQPSLEVTDIDIAYRREQYSRVHGFVIATGNASPEGITLTPAFKAGAIVELPRTASVEADGSFLFERVVPGDYVLITERPTEPLPYRIRVTSPDTGPLTVRTAPIRSASGRLVLEGDRSVTTQQFRLKLLPADPDVSAGVAASGLAEIALIRADWTLSLQPLPVPSRFVLEKAPPGWFIKSVNVSAAQPAFVPIDVPASGNTEIVDVTLVLSKTAAALSGAIVGDSSQEPSGTRVVLFATDESRWYTQSPYVVSVTADGGRFSLDSVAPGEYFVAAVPAGDIDVTAGELTDPDRLRALSVEAQRITLSEGTRRTLELRVSRAPR